MTSLPRTWHHRFFLILQKSSLFFSLLLCFLVASCVAPTQQPIVTEIVPSEPEISSPETEQPKEVSLPPEDSEVQEIDDSAWDSIVRTNQIGEDQDTNLLRASITLESENRISEAKSVAKLIRFGLLDSHNKIEYQILSVKFSLAESQPKRALRLINRILNYSSINAEQRILGLKLRVAALAQLDQPLDLVTAMIQLHSLLPNGTEKGELGHQLWRHLLRLSITQLATKLSESNNLIEQAWFRLVLGIHGNRADPYAYQSAIEVWQQGNPEHPANHFIGLTSNPAVHSPIDRIALLLPLSSSFELPARAFLDGVRTQHQNDSNPSKPQLQVIDIGENPRLITQHYYGAVNEGANFVIGPLGVDHVTELVAYGDLVIDTLILGNVKDSELASHVYQFTLAPEREGEFVARRAWQDGHKTALVLKSSKNWATRTVAAFVTELERLGGAVIQIQEYPAGQVDYSKSIKTILNLSSSTKRYEQIKAIAGRSLDFVPRPRQDADFMFLVADAPQGRLIKPHLDFLNPHNLPVYSTSKIFDANFDKINDQDLNNITFPDMDWLVDESSSMLTARSKLTVDENNRFQRIFAMGVDSYNVVNRLRKLRENSDARFHGITGIIGVDEFGVLHRTPSWVQFNDGMPELISSDIPYH